MVHEIVGESDDARAICELLVSDLETKKVYPNFHWRIDRRHYLRSAGVDASTRSIRDIFDYFDAIIVKAREEDVSQIEAHIKNALKTRTLALTRKGLIDKRRLEHIFGHPEGSLNALLSASVVFVACEREVVTGAYVPDKWKIADEDCRRLKMPFQKRSPFTSRTAKSEEGRPKLRDRLRALFAADLAAGTVPRNPRGGISREAYAERLGCSPSAIGKYRLEFEDCERRLGGRSTRLETQIPEMREWLLSEFEKGTLEVGNEGKVSVTAVCERFRTNYKSLRNCRAAWDLLDWMNGELERTNYVPAEKRDFIARFEAALPDAALNTDGLTINKSALCTALGCTAAALKTGQIGAQISAREQEVRERVSKDPLKAIMRDAVIDFRRLVEEGWPEGIAIHARNAFAEAFARESSANLQGLRPVLWMLFSHLAHGKSRACRTVRGAICKREDIDVAVWRIFIAEMSSLLKDAVTDYRYRQLKARYLNRVIEAFADAGILPSAEFKVSAGKRVTSSGRRSLAELFPSQNDLRPPQRGGKEKESRIDGRPTDAAPATDLYTTPSEYIGFARWVLMQNGEEHDKIDSAAQNFLRTLEAEFNRLGDDLPKDPVEAIIDILSRRLQLIHSSASTLHQEWRQHYEHGQTLLSIGQDPSLFEDCLSGDRSNRKYRDALSEFFPIAHPEQAKANLLRLIIKRNKGFIPVVSVNEPDQFYAGRCRQLSSLTEMQAYLIPHKDAVGSAILMYMVESGSNNAVSRTLFENSIEDSDEAGFRKVTGEKARAQGKPIVVNLPRSSAALAAMDWIVRESVIARNLAEPDDRGLMFLIRLQSRISPVSAEWFAAWFARFIARIPDFEGLGITLGMIRTSVLLLQALTNDGDLRMGLAYGQHDPASTGVYQVRGPTRYIYDRHYAKFQDRVEQLIIETAEAQSSGGMKPIGTGGYCAAGGCTEMKCWDRCPSFAIFAEVEAFADWQIWNRALRAARADWERDRPDRWLDVWLPHLVFTDVLAEKMQIATQSIRKKWSMAKAVVERRTAEPGFALPRLH